ncbi:hypothetical protein IAT38_006139 [Cryptococcus sp. DSM 104549]
MASPYAKGTLVWLPDATAGWVPGTVSSITFPEDEVLSSLVTIVVAYDSDMSKTKELKYPYGVFNDTSEEANVHPPTPPPGQDPLPPLRNPPKLATAEDLANLSNLNEPSVLHAIAMRYESQLPYTYSGIVLLSMNPFTPLKIYDSTFIQLYSGQKKGQQEPHVFAIAEEALECMRRGEGNGGTDPTGAGDQTIVVSGESGAGKTVAAKYILRYFASAHGPRQEDFVTRRSLANEEGMSETERQILASNPIMEAFGNAKTTRNDNSSRFGKYIEVLFDDKNMIVGARIRTYLLERSRLVYQPDSERNYHIFYQLLAGAPAKERKDLSLSLSPLDFAYMAGGGPSSPQISGVDDAKEFIATQAALSTVGISVERQWLIFKLLAALLHLGNIKITQARTDAVLADDDAALVFTTSLLGLPAAEFKKWTVKKQLVTRSEKIVTSLGSAQAMVVRDSVAKFVYSCLFDWLVGIVNDSLAGEDGTGARKATKFIGVLDIYGFEHFKKNSFEQFCINWANEKLQQQFNAHVFKLEQEEYMREEINWKFIQFTDNQACIDVIEGKMGILTLLDEESRLPAGADASFATKLHQQLTKPEQKEVFKKPRFNQNAFTITHYAHDVTYDVDGFIDKNRDTVPDEHLALLQGSSNDFLREILNTALSAAHTSQQAQKISAASVGSKRSAPRKLTLGSIFKNSLMSLMETIKNTNVHYIRCIKPNEAKNAWELEPQQVLSQLRACGVLETIRISCAGYPSRWEYEQFAERYHLLIGSKELSKESSIKGICSLILQTSLPNNEKYQLGLTKIFFRTGMLALLESLRSQHQHMLVTIIQKNIRRYLDHKKYLDLRIATLRLQSWWRGVLARREVEATRKTKMAMCLQRIARGYLARCKLGEVKQVIVAIQAGVRGYQAQARAVENRRLSAVLRLQSLFRGYAAKKKYQTHLSRVIILQSQWRRKLAVQELKTLKTEAKSAIKFKEISYQLENKVVELTQNLQRTLKENKEKAVEITELHKNLAAAHRQTETEAKKLKDLEQLSAIPMVPTTQFEEMLKQQTDTSKQLTEAKERAAQVEKEMATLTEQIMQSGIALEEKSISLETVQNKNIELEQTVDALREELHRLREQVQRSNFNASTTNELPRQTPSSPTQPNGLRSFEHLASGGSSGERMQAGGFSRRRNRRHSITEGHLNNMRNTGEDQSVSRHLVNPRAVSVLIQNRPGRHLDLHGVPLSPAVDSTADEIIRLLEDEQALEQDVMDGLIRHLKIPVPSLHNPPTAKEILFPAHLISLISNEMWKRLMIPESERFLADVMQAIQTHVMTYKGEDIIIPGVFWLSNVQELLSFISVAEDDASKGYAPGADGGRDLDWGSYDRLIGVVKHDLDSLEYNIYHTFMLEAKRKLSKMVVPALIESQSLPGFITSDGSGRMFSRMLSGMGGATQPAATMDDILNLLNRVWKCLKSYYMEESVMHQVVTELLKLIGQISFNDLIMRRNFCSWKREWCKSHDMPEGLLQLEHLMQATKLLQLKKATMGDIDILFDVCWILSPTQVQKLISQYHTADYEVPLNPEILRAVAARVRLEDKSDQLLLTPETDEVGPYQIPPPREIAGLETYIKEDADWMCTLVTDIPAWLQVPSVRRLATSVA